MPVINSDFIIITQPISGQIELKCVAIKASEIKTFEERGTSCMIAMNDGRTYLCTQSFSSILTDIERKLQEML